MLGLSTSSRGRSLLLTGMWVALYAGAILVGRSTRVDQLALVWPAAGVGFLWLWSQWRTPWRTANLAVLVVTTVVMNLITGAPLWLSAAFGVANALQATVAVGLYLRFRETRGLDTSADVRGLLVAALAGAGVSSLAGGVGAAVAGGTEILPVLGQWVLRNTVGSVVVASVGLRLLAPVRKFPLPSVSPAERVGMALSLVVGYGIVFWVADVLPVSYLVPPLSAWLALRLSTTAAAWHLLPVSVAVVAGTLTGHGVFAMVAAPMRPVMAQSFILVVLVMTLLVSLTRDERARLAERLADQAAQSEAVHTSLQDGVLVLDATGAVVSLNPAAADMLGVEATDPVDIDVDSAAYRVTRPDGTEAPESEWPAIRALRGETVLGADLVVSRPNQSSPRVLSVNARPLLSSARRRTGAVVSLRDVTEQRKHAEEVRRSRDLFGAVLSAATQQSIIGTDVDGFITVFNAGAERMLGYTAAEMTGRTPEIIHDEGEVVARAAELGVAPGFGVFVSVARETRHETREWTYVRKDGSRLTVELTVSAMRDSDGEITGYIGVATDITAELAAQRDLLESEERFRLAFANAPVGMLMLSTGPQARISRVNQSLCQFLGRAESEIVGAGITELVHPDDRAQCLATLAEARDGGDEGHRCELGFTLPDGSRAWGLLSASVVRGADGLDYVVCLVQDMTARRLAEQALAHQALHDALTALPNRVLFHDRLEHALAAEGREGNPVGVLFLDLDGFKEVNDTSGHAAGDEVLREVAARLLACVRPGDTVARLSGDEFAVICPAVGDVSRLEVIAERVRHSIDSGPVAWYAGQPLSVSTSIGATVSDGHSTPDQLVQQADSAMYAAKRAGRNQVRVAENVPVPHPRTERREALAVDGV